MGILRRCPPFIADRMNIQCPAWKRIGGCKRTKGPDSRTRIGETVGTASISVRSICGGSDILAVDRRRFGDLDRLRSVGSGLAAFLWDPFPSNGLRNPF